MQRNRLFSSITLLLVIVSSLSVLYTNSVIAATESFYVNAARGRDIRMCGTPLLPCKSINFMLDKVTSSDSMLNIAAGTYNEVITIDGKNVSLVGIDPSNTIIVGSATQPTVSFTNCNEISISNIALQGGITGIQGVASNVTAKNLTIQGATENGIYANWGSTFQAMNCNVNNNGGDGIRATSNSSIRVDNCTVTENQGSGVRVTSGGYAYILSSTISSNKVHGASAENGSKIDASNSNLTSNSSAGLFAINSANATIGGSTIAGNQDTGVHIAGHASARLSGANKIINNGVGINIQQTSQVTIQANPNSSFDLISYNNGDGIGIGDGSNLFFVSGTVNNNKGNGITMGASDSIHLWGSEVNIRDNDGWGLWSSNRNQVIQEGANILGNKLGQIFYAQAQGTYAICLDSLDIDPPDGNRICDCPKLISRTTAKHPSTCSAVAGSGSCTAKAWVIYSPDGHDEYPLGSCCVCEQ